MVRTHQSFRSPAAALMLIAAGIAALLAIASLHAQVPAGPACVPPPGGLVNHPPVATDDQATTYGSVSVIIKVLANDTDPDGHPLTVATVTQPARGGTVTINADQTLTFKPAAGFSGVATFTYVVKDGFGGMASATVTVNVTTLVLALSFDDGIGTVAADASGFHNDGTLLNGAAWTAAGKYGGAVAFDGLNDMIRVANAGSLNPAQMTIEAWVRPAAVMTGTGWRNIFLKQLSSASSDGLTYALYANSGTDGGPGAYIRPSGFASDQHASVAAGLTADWHHLAATYDLKALRLYVDGALVATRAASTALRTSTLPAFIGGNPLWGEYFKGTIDDLRVYNRALSDLEIQVDKATPIAAIENH
jgi:Concanavalin A-like lectin/glucanases superfamily/Bacterial Ig domain